MIIAKFFWAAFISDMVVESQVFSNMVQFFEWTIIIMPVVLILVFNAYLPKARTILLNISR